MARESMGDCARVVAKSGLVLKLLLDGPGKNQIVAYQTISENTVSGCLKAIYRYFGVPSHAELLSRFRSHCEEDL
ncbi:DNA-binding transcriptional regulator, CsgD family [Terrimicrobium sacchariphilum]|uniref:DNA-binding transcriptional regulator, CsgD family n=1 Tax=Terrimicrobium sacchariphilum TaxID=690879 RepID=A0A146G1B4_TERSA|nr:DNA-binding transcriptional regulator, CsgD family [Terrimicrobium sacchariphilum]